MKRITVLSNAFLVAAICYADKAYLGIHIEDEVDHKPLSGINVIARFEDDIGWRAWTEEANPDIVHGITDQNGFCRLSGKTNCGQGSIWIESVPDKYYKSHHGGEIEYANKSLFGTWQPENVVVTLALQRVESPIPLYVKQVEKQDRNGRLGGFDGTNAVMRFDFIEGDWLPPDGNGKHADIAIKTHYAVSEVWTNRYESKKFYDFTNEIEFPGDGNGIYEESFADKNFGIKFRIAPTAGYLSGKTLRFGCRKHISGVNVYRKDYTESENDRCYCFRIRSKFNENGELTEAYYGKIYSDFSFKGWDHFGFYDVNFLYYLNPTSLDRNLEWDMKNNLCPKPGRFRLEP